LFPQARGSLAADGAGYQASAVGACLQGEHLTIERPLCTGASGSSDRARCEKIAGFQVAVSLCIQTRFSGLTVEVRGEEFC
jgi:hypothetical protein